MMWTVAAAWAAFGGTHLAFARAPVRARAVAALGERGFTVAYATVAAGALCGLGGAMAWSGASGGSSADGPLAAASFVGAAWMAAGLAGYGRSAVLAARRGRAPVSRALGRHPFFAGLALLAGAHAALLTHPAHRLYFGGFAALAVAGMFTQDRKLAARSPAYAAHVASAGLLPRWPGARVALTGLVGAAVVAALHPLWTTGGGAPLAWLTAAGGSLAVARQLAHHTR